MYIGVTNRRDNIDNIYSNYAPHKKRHVFKKHERGNRKKSIKYNN